MNPDGEDRAAKGAEGRMRWVLVIVGGLMVLMGGVWTLQGIGVLPGSFMTGQTFWSVAGLLTLVAGAALCYAATRLGSRRR
jgi:hypothetical protein